MKNILSVILLSITLLSFKDPIKNNYNINGTIKGIADGTYVYLEKQEELAGLKIIDSVKILKNKFTFTGNVSEPEVHLIQVKDLQGKVAIILEPGTITVDIDKENLSQSIIGGTLNNNDLQKFNESAMIINHKMQKYQQDNTALMQEAQIKNDEVTINKIMADFEIMRAEMMSLSIDYPEKNPKSFLSILMLDNMFNQPNYDIDKINSDYEKLDISLKNLKSGKSLKSKIDQFKSIKIGGFAPDFSGPSPDGKTISLKQSLGKVTIIDFWASWCGPCRKENPSVVALYNEFHSKGLNIIGVSLDKDKNKWIDAIDKDKLTWPQISNLKYWTDPIAVMYNVKSIPATFILDASGKIVATNLRGDQLRAKIIELLK